MDDLIIAFLITFIIGCPEITVFDRSGFVRFHLIGVAGRIAKSAMGIFEEESHEK